jgi:hypothetical protein
MTLLPKEELNSRFIASLGTAIEVQGSVDASPLTLRILGTQPRLCRAYLFNATNPPGGRPDGAGAEHKINLRLQGQARDARANFDFSGDALVVLGGYVDELDVFVLWDSSLYRDFSFSTNVQVKSAVLAEAVGDGAIHETTRRVRMGIERVLVTPANMLLQALEMRFPTGAPDLSPMPTWAAIHDPSPVTATSGGGREYVSPTRHAAGDVAKATVFDVDPELLDRATAAHMDLQDQLADEVRSNGREPLSPLPEDPQFDLAWRDGEVAYVVEVKSLTAENEERQLRLGLGQLLTYMFLINWEGATAIRGVLAVEHQPTGEHWPALCASLEIALVWPGNFEGLFE